MASVVAVSAITVTNLTADSFLIGQIVLKWGSAAPLGQGCIPYMKPAVFKIYHGTTTSFTDATLLATVPNSPFPHSGLSPQTKHYYWVTAVDPLGNEGTPAGPVDATTAVAPASAGDLSALALTFSTAITTETTQRTTADSAQAGRTSTLEATVNNPTTGLVVTRARVLTEETARATADSALSTRIDSVEASVGDSSADARIEFQADAGPGSAASSITLKTRRTVGGAQSNAGMRISTPSSGLPFIDFTAAQFRFLNAAGTPVVTIDSNGKLSAQSIDSPTMFIGGVGVPTSLIGLQQVTQTYPYVNPGSIALPSTAGAQVEVGRAAGTSVLHSEHLVLAFVTLGALSFSDSNAWGSYYVILTRNDVEVGRTQARPDDEGQHATAALGYSQLDNAQGPITWKIQVQKHPSSPGPGLNLIAINRMLSWSVFKR